MLWNTITCPTLNLCAAISGTNAITKLLAFTAPKASRGASFPKGEAAITVGTLTVAVELAATTGSDPGTTLPLTAMTEIIYGAL